MKRGGVDELRVHHRRRYGARRQFADALWLADADPRLGWLKLVGAVESAANSWESARHESPVEQLRRHRKRTYNAIRGCGDDVIQPVAKDLAGTFKATQKFKDFLLEFDPGPPANRPDIGRLDRDVLDDALDWIYEHRSRELHAGIAFPGPLCEAPPGGSRVPADRFPALAAESQGGRWTAEQLSMYLHTIAYIRRWRSSTLVAHARAFTRRASHGQLILAPRAGRHN